MGLKLETFFNSLTDFYNECDILEDTGNRSHYEDIASDNDPHWVGMSLVDIPKYKYFYNVGLDNLPKLETELEVGSSKNIYKWDEEDGDDMSYDRLIEGLPAMRKRIRTIGNKNGRFIHIHVNICELWDVNSKEMLHKAYTAVKLVDYLESQNFKVQISVCSETEDLGYLKDEPIDYYCVEVVIKKFEDPLILPQVLTCISPWMFRHHFFKFETAKFRTYDGLGHVPSTRKTSTRQDIYISSGDCLNPESSDIKIKEIIKLFQDEEDLDE